MGTQTCVSSSGFLWWPAVGQQLSRSEAWSVAEMRGFAADHVWGLRCPEAQTTWCSP